MSSIELAYRRFATKRFPLPSEGQVRDLERRIGVNLPSRYREFLLEFNGAYFDTMPEIVTTDEEFQGDALACLHGIGASHSSAELASPGSLAIFEEEPPNLLPIGDTVMGGLIVLIVADEDSGAVYLKKAFGGFCRLAGSIEDFFSCLRESPDAL